MPTTESNSDAMNNNDDQSPIVAMLSCPQCGILVPESNMELHQLRSCNKGRAAAAPAQPDDHDDLDVSMEDVEEGETETTLPARPEPIDLTTPPRPQRQLVAATAAENNNDGDADNVQRRVRRRGTAFARNNNDHQKMPANNAIALDDSVNDDSDNDNNGVIDLMDDSTQPPPSRSSSQDNQEEQVEEQWTCSRCTLLNPIHAPICNACEAPNPNAAAAQQTQQRAPDATRRERLIGGDQDDMFSSQMSSSASYLSGGALMGGLFGAAASYARGRPMASGALEGAVHGAVGGALVNELFRDSSHSSTSSATAQTHQGTRHWTTQSFNPRSGSTTTTVYTTPRGSFVFRRGAAGVPAPRTEQDLDMLMQALMAASGTRRRGAGGLDGMTYEQLLSRFGDGSENMGATEAQISALPESTVQQDDDAAALPSDCQQCCICMEEFAPGDKRKILPCLHGFHGKCVDKWLRQNGACPICKFRLTGSGSDGG